MLSNNDLLEPHRIENRIFLRALFPYWFKHDETHESSHLHSCPAFLPIEIAGKPSAENRSASASLQYSDNRFFEILVYPGAENPEPNPVEICIDRAALKSYTVCNRQKGPLQHEPETTDVSDFRHRYSFPCP